MVKKYGAVPPLQTIFIDPHSVGSEVSTSKLNPKAAGRIARTSEDSNSIFVKSNTHASRVYSSIASAE